MFVFQFLLATGYKYIDTLWVPNLGLRSLTAHAKNTIPALSDPYGSGWMIVPDLPATISCS